MKIHDNGVIAEIPTKVALPFRRRFTVAGSTWLISTNSVDVLNAAQETFIRAKDESSAIDLTVDLYVDFELGDVPRWSRPHFRALDHLYYHNYGPADALLVDQRRRRVVGSFCAATSREGRYWRRVILPFLVGTVSASVGITPLHCACLVKDGCGLLLSGESGAGKSTLALSLSLNGFAYLADDCTYISQSDSAIRVWGLPTPIKLLPDAARHFSQLLNIEPGLSFNGELSFEVDPVETLGLTRSVSCEPRWVVFVERSGEPGAVFERVSSSEAASRFSSDLELLPSCISSQRAHQLAQIDALVKRECWLLRHGMTPLSVAQKLTEFCKT